MIGMLLCSVAVVGLVAIGVGALLAPGFSSGQYGIVVPDARENGFLRAMGGRDLALGIVLGLVMSLGSRVLLAASIGASALVALVDFAVVWSDAPPAGATAGPPRALSLAMHGIGIVGLSLAGLLVALGW